MDTCYPSEGLLAASFHKLKDLPIIVKPPTVGEKTLLSNHSLTRLISPILFFSIYIYVSDATKH